MAKDLRTGWKRIGRSGPTVDGREIKPEMIRQAAANYKKDLFTALIWPEHYRYLNLGMVEEVRAADNEEGGVDLYAILAPNEFYLQANHAGQKLFTSMELMPDFRKTGQWYLTGLAATDDPASAATTEMRLSASAKPGAFLANFVDHEDHQFQDQNKPGFMQRLAASIFNKQTFEDEDMADKAEIEKLSNQVKELTEKLAALKTQESAPAPAAQPSPAAPQATDEDKFSSLIEKVADTIVAKIDEKFSKKEEKPEAGQGEGAADQFKALQDQLKDLTEKFNAAMKEQPGTQAGEHFGSGDKAENYM